MDDGHKDEFKPGPEVKTQAKAPISNWKLFIISTVVVFLVLFVAVFFVRNYYSDDFVPPPKTTGLAVYDPRGFVEEWKLVDMKTNLAEMPPGLRTELLSQGVVDAAVWEFKQNDKELYFWIRTYKDNETIATYDSVFNGPVAWRTMTIVPIGDEGLIGVYRIEGNDPLLVWSKIGNQMFYISYYNYVGENGSAYNATDMIKDQNFLVGLEKKFISLHTNASR